MYCNGTDWIAFGALNPSAGGSGCTNPDRAEGAVVYNNSFHVLQYCDGDDWRAVGGTVAGGGGCTAPASCPNVGDVCSDGSLFAGFMVYDGSCEPIYVTDNNQSTSSQWKTATGTNDITNPDDPVDRQYSRDNRGGGTFSAFQLCENNTYHGKNDWYLPARTELNLLWLNQAAIDAGAAGNFTTGSYWSSTEYDTNTVWYQNFGSGNQSNSGSKTDSRDVRCVRRDGVVDDTPNAFSFIDQTGVATSTLIESDIVEITKMDNGTAVSITGDGSPEYRICADVTCGTVNHDWTSGSGSIDPDEYLQLRLTSNATNGAMNSATVTVGTENDQWDVTTEAADCPNIGDVRADGSIYAGLSPDGNVAMYATPADAPGGYQWAPETVTPMESCTDGTPGTASSCRTGRANTSLLAGLAGPFEAADYCDGLSAHGHDDWYLPAQDELDVLYDNRGAIGGFSTGWYWSSSDMEMEEARVQRFSTGEQNSDHKDEYHRVRCVRR